MEQGPKVLAPPSIAYMAQANFLLADSLFTNIPLVDTIGAIEFSPKTPLNCHNYRKNLINFFRTPKGDLAESKGR